MSEHAPKHHESYAEEVERFEHTPALPTPEQATGEVDSQQLETTARAKVEQTAEQANPLEQLAAADKAETEAAATPTHVNHELKNITLKRELQQIQRTLPAGQRAFSKVVHQPVVRAVSEAAGKSITRPSGLLGGGLVALIGSTAYLYLAKHIGFTYNYLVFLMLFVVGFGVGIVLELAVWSVTARRRHIDL